MDLNEHYALQLSDWEYRGRGLLDPMNAPVLPEPPFRPFLGYYIPKPKRVDDGRSEGFFGKLLGSRRRSEPAQIEDSEDEQDEDGPDQGEQDQGEQDEWAGSAEDDGEQAEDDDDPASADKEHEQA